jgi:hypothetical protein
MNRAVCLTISLILSRGASDLMAPPPLTLANIHFVLVLSSECHARHDGRKDIGERNTCRPAT